MKREFFLLIVFIASGIFLAPVYSHAASSPNIVLIVIDALRKDHLSCYGYERNTSPTIDALAGDGTLFENDVSQAPWTVPSMASMFTSMYPSQTGVGVPADMTGMKDLRRLPVIKLKQGLKTLAETLGGNGYRTIAVSANPLTEEMLRGFKETMCRETRADEVVDTAMKYLGEGVQRAVKTPPAPLFLYMHFMDVHTPLNLPPPYNTMYVSSDTASLKHSGQDGYVNARYLDTEGFRVNKACQLARYDGALTFIDSQLKLFLEFLKKNGLYENTVIVVTSDHGEEFWDHALFEKNNFGDDPRGEFYGIGHGHSMFNELLDVPLIFKGREVPRARIRRQVRNLDIAPTLLDLAGIKKRPSSFRGVDVIQMVKENRTNEMPAFSEEVAFGYEKKSLQDERYQYIRCPGCKVKELLFDKMQRPYETVNLAAEHPEIKNRLSVLMDELLKGINVEKHPQMVIDEETRKRLRSVGYLH